MKKTLISIIALSLVLSVFTPPLEKADAAFRPSGYTGKLLTRLNEGGSESTFNTTPGTAPDSTTLTTAKIGDFIVLTINPGAANEEKVSATAVSVSGTTATWTIGNRGLSFTENAVVTANKNQHAIGEVVIISDDDHFLATQFPSRDLNEDIVGAWTFPMPTGAANPATKSYVDSVVGGITTTDRITVTATAGESFATGTPVYFRKSDARWYKGDIDVEESAEFAIIGIAQGQGASGSAISGGVLLFGLDSTQVGMTAGDNIFLSSAAGATTTSTTTVGIGKARSATSLYVNPFTFGPGFATDNTFTGSTTFNGNVYLNGTATSTIATASTSAYTTTFTWAKPNNIKYVVIEAQAGGGGGGGTTDSSTATGGGGGGGYCRKVIRAASLGATETVTVGAAGAAGAGTGGTGGTGGTSSFGSHCSATGGAGGAGSANGAGGAGGAGSGGDFNRTGQSGGQGASSFDGASARGYAGEGGDSALGFGAQNVFGLVGDAGGAAGVAFGGGGGGSINNSGSNDTPGGAGAAGVVVITEVYY